MTKKKGRSRFIFCCLAPAVILFTIFMLIPTIDVFRMSLYKWGGYTADKTFVGLDNFKTLLQSEKFYQAFQNSVLLIVIVTIVTFAMAIIFAAILTREKLKGQTFFRVVFYIPNILSVVVISAIFSAIYDPNQGLLNSFLNLFRGQDGVDNPILWLGSQKLVIYSIIIAFTIRKLILIVLITKNVRVVRILVQISGRVIEKNCLILPAPSRLADS